MRGCLAVWRREWHYWLAHPSERWLSTGLPVIMLVFLAWVFAAGPVVGLPIAVVDQDQSGLSRQLVRLVAAVPTVEIAVQAPDMLTAKQALEARHVYAIMQVPEGFERALLRQSGASVAVLTNAQLASHASQITGALQPVIIGMGAMADVQRLEMHGLTSVQAWGQAQPIAVQGVALGNADLSSQRFLQLPLSMSVLSILAMVSVVSAFGRELRDGSAAELASAAGSNATAVLAKVIAYGVLYSLWFLAALWLTHRYSLAVVSSTPALVLATVLLAWASVGAGVLVVAVTLNFRMALSITGFYAAPAFAFAGHAFPLVAMPPLAQWWAEALPLTHWLRVFQASAIDPALMLWPVQQVLVAFAVSTLLLGMGLFWARGFNPARWGGR
ncbi:ABC transporter permease [Salinispirillum sp. LH 10-3-1]|uniref:ABC transporter permease n=1 Tax=Salinispirillum sp. LH 10-3-1 TaxID=2952525 RepID=A0AB38YIN7_9GAMM